ncbi:putative chromatin regulator PHD family [Helianthus annuus]|uniref:Chromatin regulator PHD family n=1 Tax=Helianthus annuus TaxID=4232 RepID=A0A9K3DXY4_HELAN|nr:protein OBERON 3-like [Helianthus annuus]KAF5763514.1 putative chromatin regulator PHD family [Helianthus annuus]KAJ0450330.1 putative chromatin regulator PHD family [Helianthus annuus]KAJ0472160.1 putative chromatin regulator PHD family [Helianthus annuus]KAJ0651622.1 putative chromatin regulator PHD family [Helianthus annuus]KAJ0692325.1 putative chromatin regulator PHD family [Helianthus annuus]
MLKDIENYSTDCGQNSESKLTQLTSDQNQWNQDHKLGSSDNYDGVGRNLESKSSKLGLSQELTLSYLCDNSKLGQNQSDFDKFKGKLVVSEDNNNNNINSDNDNKHDQDENRFVERDFLQLSENSNKREVEEDESYGMVSEKKPKLETLDLSLALPDTSMSLAASNRVQDGDPSVSLRPTRSLQSLGRSNSNNTQTTFSNDFTTGSMSYSYSHQFSHNPSCSMTRNSTENYEYSMGSHRRDCDQIWNGGEGTNGSVHSRFRPVGDGGVALVQGNRTSSDNNMSFFPSELPARMKMDTQSGDSRGKGSENTKGVESLDFVRSRKLSRPERILREIVSESVQTMAQITQELPDETFESTKEYLKKLITVPEKRDELVGLQLRLLRRSDLTSETLLKANRNQLVLLVSIRMGLDSFLSVQNRIPTNELIEIFLLERCKNVNCKRLLPVEDCDCKICSTKKGFCSECMCPVCLNFDCANNTCSWVGCDVCSHWCHAACSIQKNLIKPGPSLKGPTGTTEMQFNCPCCDHASEMFGFIKDVFRSCAEQWGLETLIKELNCVRKIFRGSEDFKGQKLHLMAGELISKLENKVMSTSDVCITILQFFNSVDAGLIPDVPILNPSLKDPIPPSKPHQTSLYNTGSSSGRADDNSLKALNTNKMVIEDEWSVKPSKKDAFDSVENLVRIKEAEARMFQNKADEARREAEGYTRMIRTKIEKLDEEYTVKIAKVNLHESEEERKKKAEEVKVSENDHCEYYKMKMRMQAEIAGLLERMEKTKRQWVV